MIRSRWLLLVSIFLLMTSVASAAAPNDPYWSQQWSLQKVGIQAAWATSTGTGIKIAILDTGVDLAHVDLAANLMPGKSFVAGSPSVQDANGHGTFTAGVAAAVTNNGIGVAGAARGAKIVPLRIAGADGAASNEAVTDAMRYAYQTAHAQVISLSFGAQCLNLGTCIPQGPVAAIPAFGLDDAIEEAFEAGSLVVVSAGNDTSSICNYPGFSPFALCVGSTNATDGVSGFSNRGLRVDVMAPGDGIISTYYEPTAPTVHSYYGTGSGTSAAAPLVAGIGALLMSMGATNVQARRMIECTAKDLGSPGYDTQYGWGRVDAAAAVAKFRTSTIC